MLQISRQTEYGVLALLDLASFPPGSRLQTSDVAQRQAIPESYLIKIVNRLAQVELLQTYRGTEGGIALARPAEKISMLEIVQALEGKVNLNICSQEPAHCKFSAQCQAHSIWFGLQNVFDQYLESIKLSDLIRPPTPI
ncbi:MAG: Rrf2 family transcriptional regulator [Anaerolineae bacterium]